MKLLHFSPWCRSSCAGLMTGSDVYDPLSASASATVRTLRHIVLRPDLSCVVYFGTLWRTHDNPSLPSTRLAPSVASLPSPSLPLPCPVRASLTCNRTPPPASLDLGEYEDIHHIITALDAHGLCCFSNPPVIALRTTTVVHSSSGTLITRQLRFES